MKYRVVIRAFTLRRDVANAAIFAKILERQGCEVFIACARNFDWVVRHWKPHAIVLNTVGRVMKTRKLVPDSLIFHQPAEGSEFLEQSDAMLFKKHANSFDEVAGVFVWGRVPLSYYDQVMPDCDRSKLHVCGNPRLDMLKFNQPLPNNQKGSKSIGVVSRFTQINDHQGAPTSHFLMRPWNLPRVIRECIGFHVSMRFVERILKETDYSVSWRPYPLEASGTYKTYPKSLLGNRFEIDDTLDFANWASRHRFIVSQVSTTFVEPYLLGIPLISLDRVIDSHGSENKWDGYVSQDAGALPKTLDEAMEVIKADPVPKPPKVESVERVLDECHGYHDAGSALKRSADIIMRRLGEKKFPSDRHWPRPLVDARDWLSFGRAMWKDTFHANMNYKSSYHPLPRYFDDIVDNIMADRSTMQ
jgi:surface carbohydrate biosynthesis protein